MQKITNKSKIKNKCILAISLIALIAIITLFVTHTNNFNFITGTTEQKSLSSTSVNNNGQVTNEEIDTSESTNIAEKYIDTSTYTKEYTEYMKLSEEDKKKVSVVPPKHPIKEEMLEDEYVKKLYNRPISASAKASAPATYDLRNTIGSLDIEDQGDTNLCWAYASNKALETNIKLKNSLTYDFSESYLAHITSTSVYGSDRTNIYQSGGNSEEAFGIMSVKGAVTESVIPNGGSYSYSQIANASCARRIKQYTPILSDKQLKSHIQQYGGVTARIKSPERGVDFNDSTNAFCKNDRDTLYDEDAHLITIIGWDDNFSRNNFYSSIPKELEEDGAWLAVNSWGSSWGNGGYFWISYSDPNVYDYMFGVISTDEIHENNVYYPSSNFTLKCGPVISNPSTGEYVVQFNRKQPSTVEYIDYVVLCASRGSTTISFNKTDNSTTGTFTNSVSANAPYIDQKSWLVRTPSSQVNLTGNSFAVKVKYTMDSEINNPSVYGLFSTGDSSGSTYVKNGSSWNSASNDVQLVVYTRTQDITGIRMKAYPKLTYYKGDSFSIANGTIEVLSGTTVIKTVSLSECQVSRI